MQIAQPCYKTTIPPFVDPLMKSIWNIVPSIIGWQWVVPTISIRLPKDLLIILVWPHRIASRSALINLPLQYLSDYQKIFNLPCLTPLNSIKNWLICPLHDVRVIGSYRSFQQWCWSLFSLSKQVHTKRFQIEYGNMVLVAWLSLKESFEELGFCKIQWHTIKPNNGPTRWPEYNYDILNHIQCI